MKKTSLAFVFLFLISIGLLAIEYILHIRRQDHILRPIPDQTYAVVQGAITTPTLTPTLTPTSTSIPTPTPTPTPKPTPTPIIIVTPPDLEALFIKYSDAYSINKELLERIANCESRLNPNASNKNYAGLFQFSEQLWIQTRALMGLSQDLSLRFNAEESIQTAAFMISQNHLGIWPNCNK